MPSPNRSISRAYDVVAMTHRKMKVTDLIMFLRRFLDMVRIFSLSLSHSLCVQIIGIFTFYVFTSFLDTVLNLSLSLSLSQHDKEKDQIMRIFTLFDSLRICFEFLLCVSQYNGLGSDCKSVVFLNVSTFSLSLSLSLSHTHNTFRFRKISRF